MNASRAARVIAQCKVNLWLRVLAREAGGYHQLETLFCRLALGDEVTVRVGVGGRSLDISGQAMPHGGLGAPEKNLAWRAALAFADAARWPTGFSIEIDKRIPVGGGLGGGSADAGAVLRCLNALAPEPLSNDTLLGIAGSLGADVPFLTQSRTSLALGFGRGDQLLALPALASRGCDLALPPFGVDTAEAYRWLSESPAQYPAPRLMSASSAASWSEVDLLSYNEFERVVFPQHASLSSIVSALRASDSPPGFPVVRMSGSGSTLFALHSYLGDIAEAAEIVERRVALRVPGTRIHRSSTASSVEAVRVLD